MPVFEKSDLSEGVGTGHRPDNILSSLGLFHVEEKQVNGGGGLERSAGSREESDGCDLAGLFVLEHVDKNDQHKLRALHPPQPPPAS